MWSSLIWSNRQKGHILGRNQFKIFHRRNRPAFCPKLLYFISPKWCSSWWEAEFLVGRWGFLPFNHRPSLCIFLNAWLLQGTGNLLWCTVSTKLTPSNLPEGKYMIMNWFVALLLRLLSSSLVRRNFRISFTSVVWRTSHSESLPGSLDFQTPCMNPEVS